jgi:Heterokaryon incompatibility protein (HET)
MPPAVTLCFSTASNAMYTLANGWLDQCSQTHPSCQALAQKNTQDWLPKRLIFVGEAGEATLQLRVLETSHFTYSQQQYISYCTLSHRWGNGNIPKLTQVNLETWKTATPQSALPLTFQHAIDVARGLNLKFVWIDALCILQDSKEELQQEIERMGTIFMYSKVTIAALAANDSTDGLFTWRNPLALYPLSIPALHDARITVQPPYTENSDELLNHDLSFNAKEDAPLLDRGWVFQEQVLSPRTLFYGRQGLYWECREAHSSDFTPDFEPGGWSDSDKLFPYLKGLFVPFAEHVELW